MAILRSLIRFGVAKKVYDEARKPQNQQRAKDLWAKATGGRSSGGRSSGGRTSKRR